MLKKKVKSSINDMQMNCTCTTNKSLIYFYLLFIATAFKPNAIYILFYSLDIKHHHSQTHTLRSSVPNHQFNSFVHSIVIESQRRSQDFPRRGDFLRGSKCAKISDFVNIFCSFWLRACRELDQFHSILR